MCSTSSQASADLASGSNEPECEPSRSVRSIDIPALSSQSTGLTFPAPATSPLENSSQAKLTLSAAASRARTSAVLAAVPDLPESVRDSGGSSFEPFAWFDRNTRSWRTWQRCLVEGWEQFSETWPRSGMTRNGIAFRRAPLVPLTEETASGLLPTPEASNTKAIALRSAGRSPRNLLPTPTRMYTRADWPMEKIQARQQEVKAATKAKGKHHTGNGFGLNLAQAVRLWPTPTINGNYNRNGASATSGDGLATAVRMWRTPNASDATKWSNQPLAERANRYD